MAAGFLAFDGACLVLGGVMLRRWLLVIFGACLIVSSFLVFVYAKRHARQTAQIAGDREALRQQARALRDLIQRN